jgi:hypothetical protein
LASHCSKTSAGTGFPGGALGGQLHRYTYDETGERARKQTFSGTGDILYVDPEYEVDLVNETHQVHYFHGSRRVATENRSGTGVERHDLFRAKATRTFPHLPVWFWFLSLFQTGVRGRSPRVPGPQRAPLFEAAARSSSRSR